MNEIIQHINELRKLKGLSQYEFAEFVGICPNTVYGWTRNGNTPTFSNIQKICDAFGITVEQFFRTNKITNLNEEDSSILNKWSVLTAEEKKIIFNVMDSFRK